MKRYTWNENFELLKQYLKENNGVFPTRHVIYQECSLGEWVSRQRLIFNRGEKQKDGSYKYKSYLLKQEEYYMLLSINFRFNNDYSEVQWLKKYNLLKEYLKENNGVFPTVSTVYKNEKIGVWAINQRSLYNNGEVLEDGTRISKIGTLSPKRKALLDELGFEWDFSAWNKNYEIFKEYKESYGISPNSRERYKKKNIDAWLRIQRRIRRYGEVDQSGNYRFEGYLLTQEEIRKLDELDFDWNPNSTITKWNNNYNLFVKYLEEHDGYFPSPSEEFDSTNLANWIYNQIKKYKKDKTKFNDEQIQKLFKIDFLNPKIRKKESKWDIKFKLFKKYLEEHNKYPRYNEESLGFWISKQRSILLNGKILEDGSIKYGNHTLTFERVRKLLENDFQLVADISDYIHKEIKNKEQMIKVQKIILYELEKILLEQKLNLEEIRTIKPNTLLKKIQSK